MRIRFLPILFFYLNWLENMKKVTEKAVKSFRDYKNMHLWNTAVETWYDCVNFYLHDNLIAWLVKHEDWTETLCIRDAWRRSNTTKERLNWILEDFWIGCIFQKNWIRYFRNPAWEVQKRDWNMRFDLI